MAVRSGAQGPVLVEQELTNQIRSVNDANAAALIVAWARAFDEIQTNITENLNDLIGGGFSFAKLKRSRDLGRTMEAIRARLEQLLDEAGVIVTTDLSGIVQRGASSTSQLITAQLEHGEVLPGFDTTSLPDRHQLDAIVRRSTERVHSSFKPLAPETEDVIKRELVRGLATGTNPRTTAARMLKRTEDRMNFSRARAENIARTETLDAYRNGGRAGEMNHSKVLAGWIWLAHLGPRTCPSCLARHGSFHNLDESGPDDHPQGRCARMPVVRRRDGSTDTSFVPDAQVFFDNLSPHDQLEIMGAARLELLRSGMIDFADLTTMRENADWRRSWQVTPLKTLVQKANAGGPVHA